MRPKFDQDGIVLYQGDCLKVMSELAPASVDTIITDPPYHLTQTSRNGSARKPGTGPFGRVHVGERGFMGKTWDGGGIAFDPQMWATVLHVAKPGAFLLAFGGTRTFHHLACALEEAGWQIRDCMMWLYGSGFPKSLDISKAIDRAAGAERKTIGISSSPNNCRYEGERYRKKRLTRFGIIQDQPLLTKPCTKSAKKWNGWGTGLKPAWEPIIVAMKPLDGTFTHNALKHGVAGLNIDGAKIGSEVIVINRYEDVHNKGTFTRPGDASSTHAGEPFRRFQSPGRWPANVLLSHHPGCEYVGHEQLNSNGHYPSRRGIGGIGASGHRGQNGLVEHHTAGELIERWRCHPHCPLTLLDQQSGERKAGGNLTGNEPSNLFKNCYGIMNHRDTWASYGDTGGAARFFYCAKTSKAERRSGLPTSMANDHPTVKPLALMEYLCKLTATPTGGIILDPFAGSGTTLLAARNVGRECIGIECDRAYVKIAEARIRPLMKHKQSKGVMPRATKK